MVLCKSVTISVCSTAAFHQSKTCVFIFVGGCPNYYRNTFHGPEVTDRSKHLEHATFESGMAARHEANDDDNFSQPRVFYQVSQSILLSRTDDK